MTQATKYTKDQPLLFTRGEDINIKCWYNKFDVKSGKHVVRFSIGDRDDNEKVTDDEIKMFPDCSNLVDMDDAEKAYAMGYLSRLSHIGIASCPFPKCSQEKLRSMWIDGYFAAPRPKA